MIKSTLWSLGGVLGIIALLAIIFTIHPREPIGSILTGAALMWAFVCMIIPSEKSRKMKTGFFVLAVPWDMLLVYVLILKSSTSS